MCFSLQKWEFPIGRETGDLPHAIIASDSAKSESEVGMKKVSLNLRLFGENGIGDAAVSGGAEKGLSADSAAEQSPEKTHRTNSEKSACTSDSFTAPVGGNEKESSLQVGEKSEQEDTEASLDKNAAEPLASHADTLSPGAMRIIQGLAAAYDLQETDIDGIAKAFNRTQTKYALEERLRRRSAAKQYQALLGEAEALSKKVQGFDLETELADRRFCGMLRCGFSMEDAWRAVHINQLLHAAVRQASEKGAKEAVEQYRREAARPDENGVKGQSGISRKTSAAHLTGRGIRDILRRVEKGAKVKF